MPLDKAKNPILYYWYLEHMKPQFNRDTKSSDQSNLFLHYSNQGRLAHWKLTLRLSGPR